MSLIVVKFGGAAMRDLAHIDHVASLIAAMKDRYERVIVVVSAMSDMTDRLFNLATAIHAAPPKREVDMLVSVGERVSMSLLAMALDKRGIQAISFTGSQTGIITTEVHTEARIVDVKPFRIMNHLQQKKVVIVAGFQGVSSLGEITTLGRGGGDTTAVALGVALSASEVEFYKDVKGVFEKDPKNHPEAVFYPRLSYKKALQITESGSRILHPRALKLAEKNLLPLHVRSFKSSMPGTRIELPSALRAAPSFEVDK